MISNSPGIVWFQMLASRGRRNNYYRNDLGRAVEYDCPASDPCVIGRTTGMKFKTNTGSLLFNSQSTEESDEPVFELSLYDELTTFSNLLPEEQESWANQPPAPTPPPARPASAPLPPLSPISATPAPEPRPERMSGPLRNTGGLLPKRPPTSELHPPRAITPNAQTYDQMKELAIELTNRAMESVSEGTRPIASEVIRRSTRELTSVPAPEPAPVADDEMFDPQTASLFKITGPLPAAKVYVTTASVLAICTSCGSHADTDEMFCITCGELLEAVQTPAVEIVLDTRCEDCGEAVAGEDIFCPSCGSVMADA
jgi:hypothetical protein